MDEYNKSNEYNVEFKVIEATDVSEYEPKLRALAESGYSVIMGMYSAMVDPILAVAADYPDIKFGSLDGNIENIADYENVGEFGLDRLQTASSPAAQRALMSERRPCRHRPAGADDPDHQRYHRRLAAGHRLHQRQGRQGRAGHRCLRQQLYGPHHCEGAGS